MTLPANVGTVTVTGTFLSLANGAPAAGIVTFEPVPMHVLDASADVVLIGAPVMAQLDANGSISVVLAATNDVDLNPINWTYSVTVKLTNPSVGWRFDMAAPAGATINLADVIPVDASGGDAIAVGGTVPTGGTAGQVLAKASSVDFATVWVPASAPGVHAATHAAGSSDPVTLTQGQITGLTAALAAKAATATTVTASAPLTGSGTLASALTLGIADFTSTSRGAVPNPAASSGRFLKDDGTWAVPAGGGGGVTDGDKGDIVVSGSGASWVLDSAVVTSAAKTVLDDTTVAAMRTTLGAAPTTAFAGSTPGLVPTSVGGAVNFLRADGQWAAPAGGGGGGTLSDGDKGDIVVSATGATWLFNTSVVTAAAKTVLDDTTTAAMLATLGAAANTAFTTSTAGIVPTPGGTSSGRFLKDDGTWALPPSGVSGAGKIFPFTYNTSTAESITGNQMRGNNATFASSTKLWISEITVDGLDVTVGLGRIKAGFQVYVQDYTSASRYALWNVTADALDKGTYWELAVSPVSSLGTIPGGKVAVQSLSSAQSSTLFSTTTTAPGLTPGSSGAGAAKYLNGSGTWTTPPGIIQQATAPTDTTVLWADTSQVGIEENARYLSNVAGTTYTLVLADRGKLILCSNAAAQTVTVPTNATAAFVIGTQIDLVQMGAGALTLAAAGGVTINATPSLGLRAQYSAASLIKTATNTWLLIGDLL